MSGATQRIVRYGTNVTGVGKGIRELIWEQLDDAMDRLMDSGMPAPLSLTGDDAKDIPAIMNLFDAWREYGKNQGMAEATAFVIALFEQPEHPDIDSVRGAAVLRYKQQQMPPELTSVDDLAPEVNHGASSQSESPD